MLACFENVGIEILTATTSPLRVSVEEQCKGLLSLSQAKRLRLATGIETLSKCPPGMDICASDFCVASAERLLARRGRRDDIGALIFITQTPDVPMPATAFLMQERLGISHEAIVFDVNLACSGFVEGVFLAASLAMGVGFEKKKILLCCGDARTPTHPQDVSLLPLRGDAGSAAIIGRESSLIGYEKKMFFHIQSYGSKARNLWMPRGGRRNPIQTQNGLPTNDRENYSMMDGAGVMEFTLNCIPPHIEDLLAYAGIVKDKLDHAILHQANKTLVRTLARNMGFIEGKVPWRANETGNTSSASIPLCLAEMRKLGQDAGKTLLLAGFGVGMSIASVILTGNTMEVLPTEDYDVGNV